MNHLKRGIYHGSRALQLQQQQRQCQQRFFSRHLVALVAEQSSDKQAAGRPNRIEVDAEKEQKYNLGPKSQAEVKGFQGFCRNDMGATQKNITSDTMEFDKANIYAYASEGLNLEESYGRDLDVENKQPKKTTTTTGTSTFTTSPLVHGETEKVIENVNEYKRSAGYNKAEFKPSGTGFDKGRRPRQEVQGVGAATFDTMNNAFPGEMEIDEESVESLKESKKAFEDGLRESHIKKERVQNLEENRARTKFAKDI